MWFAKAFVPYVYDIMPRRMPFRLAMRTFLLGLSKQPVCKSPILFKLLIVDDIPSTPLSRQWLFAIETQFMPAEERLLANSNGALKLYGAEVKFSLFSEMGVSKFAMTKSDSFSNLVDGAKIESKLKPPFCRYASIICIWHRISPKKVIFI